MGEKLNYCLYRTLRGHAQDVRALAVTSNDVIVSGSRDAYAKIWRLNNGQYEISRSVQGDKYIVAVEVVPPSEQHPNGLLIIGGYDNKITVYDYQDISAPLMILRKHDNAVTAIHALDHNHIISSGCDGFTFMWSLSDQNVITEFKDAELPVWAVIYLDAGVVVTGCADCKIRVFATSGSLLSKFKGHNDCIRALEVYGTSEFLSAGNDGIIKRWDAHSGQCLFTYSGHKNFIYAMSSFPDKTHFVTAGEDNIVCIWNTAGTKVQEIIVPARSIWAVLVLSNNDIVLGCSDTTIRIFSAKTSAPISELKCFEDEVALAMEQKQEEKFKLAKAGDQIVVNVDLEEGQPPLKLVFKKGDDPHEIAQKFITDHNVSPVYLQQVVDFIKQHSGPETSPIISGDYVDPFTGSARYIPGRQSEHAPAYKTERLIPQTRYVLFQTTNFDKIADKLLEYRGKSETDVNEEGIKALIAYSKRTHTEATVGDIIDILLSLMILQEDWLLPTLDTLRLLFLDPEFNREMCRIANTELTNVLRRAIHGKLPVNRIMGLRILSNILITPKGEEYVYNARVELLDYLKSAENFMITSGSDAQLAQLQIAGATFMLNMTIALSKTKDFDLIIEILLAIQNIVLFFSLEEPLYRALVALGNAFYHSDSKGLFPEVVEFLKSLLTSQKHSDRIVSVIKEILDLCQKRMSN